MPHESLCAGCGHALALHGRRGHGACRHGRLSAVLVAIGASIDAECRCRRFKKMPRRLAGEGT